MNWRASSPMPCARSLGLIAASDDGNRARGREPHAHWRQLQRSSRLSRQTDVYKPAAATHQPSRDCHCGTGGNSFGRHRHQRREAGFSGRLELKDAEGQTFHRDVRGGNCNAAVSALALVTALALDPEASTTPIPPAASSAAPAGSSPPQASVPRPARASKHPSVVLSPPRRSPLTPPVRPRAGASPHIAFGVDGAMRAGVTPNFARTLPVFVARRALSVMKGSGRERTYPFLSRRS